MCKKKQKNELSMRPPIYSCVFSSNPVLIVNFSLHSDSPKNVLGEAMLAKGENVESVWTSTWLFCGGGKKIKQIEKVQNNKEILLHLP